MLLAVAAVLVCVFLVATGWGGELSYERPDHAPLDLGSISATDIALMRPPTALWGYNMQVTEEALELIARAMRDRDITIATLQQQLAETGLKETQPVKAPEPRLAPNAETAESLPPSEVRLPPYLRPAPDVRRHPEPGQLPEFGQRPESAPPPEPGQRPEPPPTTESFSAAEGSSGAAPTVESPRPAEAGEPTGAVPTVESPQRGEVREDASAVPALESAQHAEIRQPSADPATRGFLRTAPSAPNAPRVPESTGTSEPAGISPDSPATTPLSAPPAPAAPQPAATQPAEDEDEPKGPQGSYDAHDWWVEQMRAAREELAGDDPSSDVDPPQAGDPPGSDDLPDDGSLAAAEEQGW